VLEHASGPKNADESEKALERERENPWLPGAYSVENIDESLDVSFEIFLRQK